MHIYVYYYGMLFTTDGHEYSLLDELNQSHNSISISSYKL
jgi:hypothetical protein